MDVINLISKVEGYPDAEVVDPTIPYQPGHKLYANGPMLHEYLSEMNQKVRVSRAWYTQAVAGMVVILSDPVSCTVLGRCGRRWLHPAQVPRRPVLRSAIVCENIC